MELYKMIVEGNRSNKAADARGLGIFGMIMRAGSRC